MSVRERRVAESAVMRQTGVELLAATVAFAGYAITIPLLAAFTLDGAPSAWVRAAAILCIVSVYSGTRIAMELSRGATRSFVLVFHSFAYVFLGVVPVIQIGARTLLWAVNPASGVLTEAALICLVGVLAFDFGLFIAGAVLAARHERALSGTGWAPASPPSHVASHTPFARTFSKRTADRTFAFLLAVTLFGLVLLAVRGGLGVVLASQSEMTEVLCPGASTGDFAECGVVTALVRVPPLVLIVVALGLRGHGSRRITSLAILAGMLGILVTANPISTSRFWFGAAVIGVFGVLAAKSTRSRVLIWLAFPAVLLLIFPILDFGRYRDWTADFSIRTDAIVQKQDFDAFQQIANGVAFSDLYGTRGGTQISSAALFFVPRSLWMDKAPATGPLVNASLGVTDNINVSAPLWEEAYVDFGLGGTIAFLLLLGMVIASVESAVKSSLARGGGLLAAVAPFFAAYGMFVLRGSLLPAIGPLTFALVLILVAGRLRTSASAHEQIGS